MSFPQPAAYLAPECMDPIRHWYLIPVHSALETIIMAGFTTPKLPFP
jgi:hypothetical protein